MSQGLSQVNNSFSSYNGTFTLPSQEELAWTTTITTAWEEREANSASEEFDETIANIAEESGFIHVENFYFTFWIISIRT